MERNLKSMREYVSRLVDLFAYEDFQPPVDMSALKAKLESVLGKDTPFWSLIELPPTWAQNWTVLKVKSFKNWEPVLLGLSVNGFLIRASIFEGIDYQAMQFEGVHEKAELSITQVWQDHEKLSDFLVGLLERCVAFANHEGPGQQRKWK